MSAMEVLSVATANPKRTPFSFENLCSLTSTRNFIVAYSGGLDSHVLLHIMFVLRSKHPELIITAVHVNHQLNSKSDKWAAHCEQVCRDFNIPISIEKINIELNPGDSLEEKARIARYDILKKYIDKKSVLLTAHNLNDQAETFLLQALRGAGPKGLSAMPVKKKFGDSFLIRPLLNCSRDELEKYARKNNLKWIEDDSNVDTKFNRNYLRHEIFPILKKRFSAVLENFSRSARLMAEQEKIISEIAKSDLAFISIPTSTPTPTPTLSLPALLQFSQLRQRLILREWFRQNNLRMPNEKHLKQIQKDVLNAASDAHPIFKLENTVLRRVRDVLVIE